MCGLFINGIGECFEGGVKEMDEDTWRVGIVAFGGGLARVVVVACSCFAGLPGEGGRLQPHRLSCCILTLHPRPSHVIKPRVSHHKGDTGDGGQQQGPASAAAACHLLGPPAFLPLARVARGAHARACGARSLARYV